VCLKKLNNIFVAIQSGTSTWSTFLEDIFQAIATTPDNEVRRTLLEVLSFLPEELESTTQPKAQQYEVLLFG